MRFSAEMVLKEGPPFRIPANYKKNFLSLFREAMKYGDSGIAANDYWSEKKRNPAGHFTYSVTFPPYEEIKSKGKTLLEFNDALIRLDVSSSDSPFITGLYNGLQKINGKFPPFKYSYEFRNLTLQSQRSINGNSALFNILSPVVVHDSREKRGKQKENLCLACKDPGFKESLANSILDLYRSFLNTGRMIRSNNIIIDSSKCSTSDVSHNNEIIPATSGYMHISAPVDVLKLIYDCGLGERRSHGFGMVEIVG